jgi:hypothetical protein
LEQGTLGNYLQQRKSLVCVSFRLITEIAGLGRPHLHLAKFVASDQPAVPFSLDEEVEAWNDPVRI